MFPHEYLGIVILITFFLWIIIITFVCAKWSDDIPSFDVTVFIAVILSIATGFFLTAPDTRTGTEKLNDELVKSNLTIESMNFLDDGKVFKFDDNYYIKVKDDQIIRLDYDQAKSVYEK